MSAPPGFTVIELTFGLVVTAMTMAAAATLMMTVSQNWQASQTPQTLRTTTLQGSARIRETLRAAKYIGWTGARSDGSGSAAFLWLKDEADAGKMDLGELGLLEFDRQQKTITLHRLAATSASADNDCNNGDIDGEGDVNNFKQLSGLTSQVLLSGVTQLNLWRRDADNPNMRPSLEFFLEVEREGQRRSEYETAVVRGPMNAPE